MSCLMSKGCLSVFAKKKDTAKLGQYLSALVDIFCELLVQIILENSTKH